MTQLVYFLPRKEIRKKPAPILCQQSPPPRQAVVGGYVCLFFYNVNANGRCIQGSRVSNEEIPNSTVVTGVVPSPPPADSTPTNPTEDTEAPAVCVRELDCIRGTPQDCYSLVCQREMVWAGVFLF